MNINKNTETYKKKYIKYKKKYMEMKKNKSIWR